MVLCVFVESGKQIKLASSDKVAPEIHPCMCHQCLTDHNSFKIHKNELGWHFIRQLSHLPNSPLLRFRTNDYTDVILNKLPINTAPDTKS